MMTYIIILLGAISGCGEHEILPTLGPLIGIAKASSGVVCGVMLTAPVVTLEGEGERGRGREGERERGREGERERGREGERERGREGERERGRRERERGREGERERGREGERERGREGERVR